MKAKLKDFYSDEVDLNSYCPEKLDNFHFWAQAEIGPDNEKGADYFSIEVCTPEWLKTKYSDKEVIFGRHMLIVFKYDLASIKKKIASYCNKCSGETWLEVANKVSRIGHWEFEDYKE